MAKKRGKHALKSAKVVWTRYDNKRKRMVSWNKRKHASNPVFVNIGKPSKVNRGFGPATTSAVGVRRFPRNRLKVGGYFCSLPCEILHKIALLLPFTSILQLFRSSKFWYNLLTDSEFIDLHLTRALQKPPGYLFTPNYECSQGRREIYTVELSGDRISTCKIFEYSTKWEANKRNKFQSSGGLMCMYSSQSNFFRIFNPNIGQEIQVDNVPIFKKCRHWWFFCYSPSTKEYKILKVGVLSRNNNIESTVGAILTVGTNTWRQIKQNIPQQDFNSVAECQGNLFWMKKRCLVSFDITSEEFHVIPGPPRDNAGLKSDRSACVGLLKARLINMGHTIACIQDYRLWMLEDITKSIWISRHEFSDSSLYRDLHVVGVSENGGLFGFMKRSTNVFSQDMGCTYIKACKILWDNSLERIAYVAPHIQSFVSPVRIMEMGNKQINDHCDVKEENVPDLAVAST